jgi:isopentenyl diphosphate isomerase/L-lactate dehydrogenase-like FMN-dependent dehydrogenase
VDRVLEWFRADLVRTMSLVGAATIDQLDRSLLSLDDPR